MPPGFYRTGPGTDGKTDTTAGTVSVATEYQIFARGSCRWELEIDSCTGTGGMVTVVRCIYRNRDNYCIPLISCTRFPVAILLGTALCYFPQAKNVHSVRVSCTRVAYIPRLISDRPFSPGPVVPRTSSAFSCCNCPPARVFLVPRYYLSLILRR